MVERYTLLLAVSARSGHMTHMQTRLEMTMGILTGMGIEWEWELVTKLGMGRNGKQPVWEWEWPLFPWESIPIGGYSVKLM